MDKNWCVYQHICPNGKVYVGITSQNPKNRWAGGFGYKNNSVFFSLIVKFGWDNIIHQVLFSNLTEVEARETEKNMIKSLGEASCNVVYKIAEDRNKQAIELSFDESDYSADDITAIRLWCMSVFGDISLGHMKEIATGKYGWKRTIEELASGDYERMVKELLYIDEFRVKRLGIQTRRYSDAEISDMARKLSGSVLDRYVVV